jgi:ectoine hydroxylase-related dioxygenase (phytanoyl-CoA dioxygenase family)
MQLCGLWLALDVVTQDSGAVEYVRGSHLWGVAYELEKFGDQDLGSVGLPKLPDIESERDKYDIISFQLQPGDCVIHHGYTIHGSPGNASSRRRRGLITRWLGDERST